VGVFRVLLIGGTGQVGSAVLHALLADPGCAEVVMVNRRESVLPADSRVRQVVLDTASAGFADDVATLARGMVAHGGSVFGASCVGVGSGSMKWTEEQLKALEVGVVGGFARGCHAGGITRFALLSAVGSDPTSRFRYVRVMGLKEAAVEAVGFERLAIFQPGIIAGNAHTPGYVAWLGRLVPGRFGVIAQDDIGRAFVAEFKRLPVSPGVSRLENREMKRLSRLV
jgi:Predicted nucleoside-diphosphate-sugar epimerases